MLSKNSVDMQAVNDLAIAVRGVINILETMDDTTYDAVDDFIDPNKAGRYTDLLDWLQHIMNVR